MGMNIYRILESHTIIEWLSRMNVKDKYVKPRVINPGGWETGRPGVQGWETGTTVSQYSSFLEDGPPDSTMLHVREVCDSSSVYGNSVMHEVVCTEICGVSQTKNQSGKRPLRGKKFRGKSWNQNSEENYVLLVFAWNQSPHRVRSKVVVQLVDMEKGLVGFPTITWFTTAYPMERFVLLPRCPTIDSTTNFCSLCCATTKGIVLSGS